MARVSVEDLHKYQGLWLVKASELETVEQNLALEPRVGHHPWSAPAAQKSLRLLVLVAQFCGAVADGFTSVAEQGRRLDGEVAETAITFDQAAVRFADQVMPAVMSSREIPLPLAPLAIPEPLPRVNMSLNQDLALFAALDSCQTKLFWAAQGLASAGLVPRHLERRYREFTVRTDTLSSEIQTIRQLLVGDRPSDRIRLDCRQRTLGALGECFMLMQAVAVPEWLSAPADVVPVPEEYLWSLTLDPTARAGHANPGGMRELRQLWDNKLHTDPEKTYETAVAIRDAVRRGGVILKPDSASEECPWGSRYVAEEALTIAGVSVPAGKAFRYVVEISQIEGVSRKIFVLGSDEEFRRRRDGAGSSGSSGSTGSPTAPAQRGVDAPARGPRRAAPSPAAPSPAAPRRAEPAQRPALDIPPDAWLLTHPAKRRELDRDPTAKLRAQRELHEFWLRRRDWRELADAERALRHACSDGFLRRAHDFNTMCPWNAFYYVHRPFEIADHRFAVGARLTIRIVDRRDDEPWLIQLGSATRRQLLGL